MHQAIIPPWRVSKSMCVSLYHVMSDDIICPTDQ